MRPLILSLAVLFVCSRPFPVCAEEDLRVARPGVVVSTSLIETAVRDLLGAYVKVIRLMPPGSCPGHFDLSPGQVRSMTRAQLVVRHDYQASLDDGLIKSGIGPERIHSVPSHDSFAIPQSYAAMCNELATRFKAEWPEWASHIHERTHAVQQRAKDEEQRAQERLRHLKGYNVLAAAYQRTFCEWAGLNVIAVYHAGADTSAWLLSRAVDMARTTGAEAVIGNQQWGERHLTALTEAARLPGIMLSNFPASGEANAYWDFFHANVDALIDGFP